MDADVDDALLDFGESWEAAHGYDAYDNEEVDHMLDELMDESEQDLAERRMSRARARGRGRPPQRVPTASGRNAYQPPVDSGVVTQKQFKEALARVGDETRRNAEGIKLVNDRLGTMDGRLTDVVTVAKTHSRRLGTLDSRMKMDGALDFASSFNVVTGADGSTALAPDLSQLLRGAIKNGVLGDSKGAMGNPWVIGIAGLVLRNPTILGGLFAPRT